MPRLVGTGAIATARPRTRPAARSILSRWRRVSVPALLTAAVALGFLAISTWWVLTDERIPNGDEGKHLLISLGALNAVREGHPLGWFYNWSGYPPLVHIVGMIGAAVIPGPNDIAPAILTVNLVFVPLLVI